jgi:prepilin-type N-terminal cleavage/methylation domain-containing protein
MFTRQIQNDRNGFTLAELLVVIAIIGTLFVIALPALMNIAGTSKLDAAANAVHSAAKMARQHAITHNQPTYLVFNEGQLDPSLAFRAYAVFSINIHTNPITQDAGYFLSDWEPLPTGVIFDDAIDGETNLFQVSTDSWAGGLNKNSELLIRGERYIVQGFKPDGQSASTTHYIYLAEGSVDNNQPFITSKQGKQIQFSTTGKSRIMDYVYEDNGTTRILGEK